MKNVILDANLLFVLLVGQCDRKQVGIRKGVKEYSPEDYDNMVAMLSKYDRVIVTPNVLTECSNLIGEDKDGMSDRPEVKALKDFISSGHVVTEEYVQSKAAVLRDEYRYLGLSDCALLSLIDSDTPLVTADARLANAALKLNQNSVNFNWYRKY